tara:strand:+ start:8672 stop:9511 length:840 start_codon:yes stop_codon:yes gene_type:complete
MKLYIDIREPVDIINDIENLNIKSKTKQDIQIIKTNLLLFDYLITNNEFNLENFENNLENILVAIERKSENDLIASIKDGRYKEQGCRMESLNLENNKIYYLIEDSKGSGKTKETERKIIQSALISLSYFKNFSLLFTKNKLETSYLIYKFCDKICIENMTNNKNKIINLEENMTTNENNNNNEHLQKNNEHLQKNNYLQNIKLSKKDNITPDNIDIIMIMQIPNISATIAQSLINEYKSIQNLIFSLKNDENILKNFKINDRKISKAVVENIKLYLHI